MEVKILSPLMTERLGNRLWVLLAPFKIIVDGVPHEMPRGFVYDGNSAPRITWALCSPVGGVFGESGPPHDYFYSLDCPIIVSRKYADNVHRAIGVHRGANMPRAKAVHGGLRLFGKRSYRKMHSFEKLNKKSCYDFEYARNRVLVLRKDGVADMA